MTEYKTPDEIEAVVLRVKLQLLRGYTYPSEGQWRDDLEDLAAALRSAVGMVREMEKSEAWLEEMNRKMERERDEIRTFADLQKRKRASAERERDEARQALAHEQQVVAEVVSEHAALEERVAFLEMALKTRGGE
jgi:uncharacterized protein (DUF3084 family)